MPERVCVLSHLTRLDDALREALAAGRRMPKWWTNTWPEPDLGNDELLTDAEMFAEDDDDNYDMQAIDSWRHEDDLFDAVMLWAPKAGLLTVAEVADLKLARREAQGRANAALIKAEEQAAHAGRMSVVHGSEVKLVDWALRSGVLGADEVEAVMLTRR